MSQAALAVALRAERKSRELPECNVISYSASASQSARSVENLLRCLVQWLRKVRATDADSPLPHSYKWESSCRVCCQWFTSCIHIVFYDRDLLSEFHSMLSSTEKSRRVVLLVDGADLIQDGKGRLSSDWIPQQLPQVSHRRSTEELISMDLNFRVLNLNFEVVSVWIVHCSNFFKKTLLANRMG